MQLNHLRTNQNITREVMHDIGNYLIRSLADHLELNLHSFRINIIESRFLRVDAQAHITGPFELSLETVLLFALRQDRSPAINAYIMLFSEGKRVGLNRQAGNSFVMLEFDDASGWRRLAWMFDDLEYVETITHARIDEYGTLKIEYRSGEESK
ncbi:MAG: hypothetical protein CMJ46_00515 [Planctomyces sp.]|nr:hypothetical protein [Planctomyces sp.]